MVLGHCMLCCQSTELEGTGVKMLLEELVAGDCGITTVTYLLIKQADKRRQPTWRFLAMSPEGEADNRPDSYQSSTESGSPFKTA